MSSGMGSPSAPTRDDVILHVVSYDLACGAEKHARALVDELNRGTCNHEILTLFSADPGGLHADHSLEVPKGLWRRIGLDPRVVRRLRQFLKANPPTAIVAHGGEPAKYVALSVSDAVPWVYLRIGSSHPRLANPIRRWVHDYYTGRADRIVAVSRDVAEELEQVYGVARSRVSVIENGRDAAEFTPPLGDRESRPPHVLFVGHLDAGKRPDWFIEVVADLRGRGVELRASMVGDGILRPGLEEGARAAGVALLGERSDVAALMAGSDLLVLTSRPPEGMPGVLIEAGLAGLAVVSTRVPGSSDVVEHGVTGLLVDVDDRVALTDAVQRLLLDADLRTEMGVAARRRCIDRFSLEASASKWSELLEELATR